MACPGSCVGAATRLLPHDLALVHMVFDQGHCRLSLGGDCRSCPCTLEGIVSGGQAQTSIPGGDTGHARALIETGDRQTNEVRRRQTTSPQQDQSGDG